MSDFIDDIDGASDLEEDVAEAPSQSMGRLRMAFARWWVILIMAILGYIVALYSLSIVEPNHTVNAALELVTKERKLVGAELEQDRITIDKTMTTIASKLIGPSQLTKVVNSPKIQSLEKAIPPAFSLKPKYWRTEEELRYQSAAEASTSDLIKMITSNVEIAPRPGTTLIDITVTHKNAESAIAIADAIMEEYLKTEEKRKAGGQVDAFAILRAEASDAAKKLEMDRIAYETYHAALETNNHLIKARNELLVLKQRYKSKHPKLVKSLELYNRIQEQFRREIDALSVIQILSERNYWLRYKPQMDEYIERMKKGDTSYS